MAIYNAAFKKAVLNNDGHAHLLTNVAAGVGTGSGFIYLFNGPAPVDADTALDMVATHTFLGKISSNAGGANGVSFAAATSTGGGTSQAVGTLPKTAAETWSTGAMTFAGFHSASGTLTATFARMGTETLSAIEGAGSTTARAQLLIAQAGDPPADINLTSSILTAGATFTLDNFQLNV